MSEDTNTLVRVLEELTRIRELLELVIANWEKPNAEDDGSSVQRRRKRN